MPDYRHLQPWWGRLHLHDELDEHIAKFGEIKHDEDAKVQRAVLEGDVRDAWQLKLKEWTRL